MPIGNELFINRSLGRLDFSNISEMRYLLPIIRSIKHALLMFFSLGVESVVCWARPSLKSFGVLF